MKQPPGRPAWEKRRRRWATSRRDCLPPALQAKFAKRFGPALLAASLRKIKCDQKRLTATESKVLAAVLWRAGADLGHGISKKLVARDLSVDPALIRRTLKALVDGGFLKERAPGQVKQPPARRQGGGSPCVGYRFPRFTDLPLAIEAYLASPSRRAQSGRRTVKAYRCAERLLAARRARETDGSESLALPFDEAGPAPHQEDTSPRHEEDTSPGTRRTHPPRGFDGLTHDFTAPKMAWPALPDTSAKSVKQGSKPQAPARDQEDTCPPGGIVVSREKTPSQSHQDTTDKDTTETAFRELFQNDIDAVVVAGMLKAEGVWSKRAEELAAWPDATPERVQQIIDDCIREIRQHPTHAKVVNPAGYIATAVANDVEPGTVRAVRETKGAGRGPSGVKRGVAIAKARASCAADKEIPSPRITATLALLNDSLPRDVVGFQVGRGAGFAVCHKGHVLIFASARDYGRDGGTALFNFDRLDERRPANLPGVLAVLPSSDFLPIADSDVG